MRQNFCEDKAVLQHNIQRSGASEGLKSSDILLFLGRRQRLDGEPLHEPKNKYSKFDLRGVARRFDLKRTASPSRTTHSPT